jgi:hypothetical protein
VEAPLMWNARIPLGASAEVDDCAAAVPAPPSLASDGKGPGAAFRNLLDRGHLSDGYPVLQGGLLRVRQVSVKETDSYDWLDPTAREVFRRSAGDQSWALAWGDGGLVMPLALVAPRETLRPPRLTHLVPGAPSVTIEP